MLAKPVIVAPFVTVAPPLNVEAPVTLRVPPKFVVPLLTLKVLLPEILVSPLSVTAPEPEVKAPEPFWTMLPVMAAPPAVTVRAPSNVALPDA
jgi:hypothetical protein